MRLSMIYPFRASCAVCGGDGMADSRGNQAAWTGGFVSHRNPAVCAAIMDDRRRRWLREHRYRVYCDGREFGKDCGNVLSETELRALDGNR